jgi:hypothetical protein
VHLITESGSQVVMRSLKVVREAGVRWVIAQGSLEPVGRRPPLRDESANGYPVTRDDDGLAMLDRIEDVGEAPCRLRGSHCDHEYTLSDLVRIYVYENLHRVQPAMPPAQGARRLGGAWLLRTCPPSGLRASMVPSGWRMTCQPHR